MIGKVGENATIGALLETYARSRQNVIALHCGTVELTFRELLDRVYEVANDVMTDIPDEVVGLLVENPIDQIVGMLAALHAGRFYWVIPPAASDEFILKNCCKLNCSTVVVDGSSALRDELVRQNIRLLEWPQTHRENASSASLAEAVKSCSRHAAGACYSTSGSSGEPKIIRRTLDQIRDRVNLYASECGFSSEDRFALMTHPGFVAAEGDIYGSLLRGAALYLVNTLDLTFPQFSDWMRSNAITVVHPPIPYFERWCESWRDVESFPQLRCVLLGGGAVSPKAIKGIWNQVAEDALIHHRYSSTEAGPVARFVLRSGTRVASQYLPMGRPFPFIDWRVENDGSSAGKQGELLLKSPYLSADAPVDSQGYYHTGDWVEVKRSQLFFLGRRDQMVKVRGYRVQLDDVSHVIADREGIVDARVIAHRGRSNVVRLFAFVVMETPDPSTTELHQELREALPPHCVPTQVIALSEMPKTPTGKHDVQRLTNQLAERPELSEQLVGDIGQMLESFWRSTSGWIGSIDRQQTLVEQGGDSLTVLEFLVLIEKSLKVTLTPIDLIRYPTLVELEEYVEARMDSSGSGAELAPDPSIYPLNQEGFTPVVCFPAGADLALRHYDLAKELDGKLSLYLLYPCGHDGKSPPLRNIEQQVDYYVGKIRSRFGNTPVVLCGFSLGGIAAYAVAASNRLNVHHLLLLDSQLYERRVYRRQSGPLMRLRSIIRHRDKFLRSFHARWSSRWARWRGRPYPIRHRQAYFVHLNKQVRRGFKMKPYYNSVHFLGSNGYDGEGFELRVKPWRQLCKGELVLSFVDTDHLRIFRYPHVSETARLIYKHTETLKPFHET
ncbi:MAG: AMP-binding protein [Pirellulaceae bacterium]|nr:AMP-binding protein [Pirellulaceae bacterium]